MNRQPLNQVNHFGLIQILIVLVLALVVRLILGDLLAGFVGDQRCFINWQDSIRQFGLADAYLNDDTINYPPFFLFILHGYISFINALGWTPHVGKLSFKLLLIIIDLVAIVFAINWMKKNSVSNWRVFSILLFALNPGLITDSAIWGQVDMLHSMLMLAAILLIGRRPGWSGVLFAIALLTKFQSVAIAPILGFALLIELIRNRSLRPMLYWLVGFIAPLLVTAIYFLRAGALTTMIRQAYTDAVGFYPSVTVNALNIWFYIIGYNPQTNDHTELIAGVSLRMAGFALLAIAVLYTLVYMWLSKDKPTLTLLKASAFLNFAFFMLPTEIHERYSVPALVFVLFALVLDRRWSLPGVILSLTVFANLLLVMNTHLSLSQDLWIAIVNVLVLLGIIVDLALSMRLSRTVHIGSSA